MPKLNYRKVYSEPKKAKFVFGLPEKELVTFLNSIHWQQDVKVLDLGCGDGRNIVFLATKNHNVLGIDNSAIGLKKIKKQSKDLKITKNISLLESSLKNIKLKKNIFDLIICVYTFHEIGALGVKNLIEQSKHSLKSGGIIYFAFFIPKKGIKQRKECYYPDKLAIISHFRTGWKVIREREAMISHSHIMKDSKIPARHKHYVCHLFLQKLIK